jgi:hypothetical protein
MGSDLQEQVRAHALQVARDKGWIVQAPDCVVTTVPTLPGSPSTTQMRYWEVKVKIRADLNTQRMLRKDGQMSGMVRISGDSLLDTLTESPNALQARLRADTSSEPPPHG